MSEPTFRQLRLDDAGSLLAFFRQLVAQDPERVERLEDVARMSLADETKWIEARLPHQSPVRLYALCCEVDGRIVAEGEFERQPRWIERHVAEIRFGVLPDFVHVASSLVDRLVAAAQAVGIEVLVYFHLATQARGLHLMEGAGFKVVGQLKNYYKRGSEYVDRIYLTRQVLGEESMRGRAKQRSGQETWAAINRATPIEESKLTDFLSKQY